MLLLTKESKISYQKGLALKFDVNPKIWTNFGGAVFISKPRL